MLRSPLLNVVMTKIDPDIPSERNNEAHLTPPALRNISAAP